MNKPPEPLTTEQCYGIAKKYTLELEKHALQSQAAVVGMMRMMVDHRQVTLQNETQIAEAEAREGAMVEARLRHAEATLKREQQEKEWAEKNQARQKDAATGGMTLVGPDGHPVRAEDVLTLSKEQAAAYKPAESQVETPSEPEAALVS